MARQETVKFSKIISYILIVLVFVSICGFVAYFTGGFTSDIKSFYVVCNHKKVVNTAGAYTISQSSPLNVEVKSTYGLLNKNFEYSYKVIPYVQENNDFDFIVNNNTHKFSDETNLTNGFDIKQSGMSFSIVPKGRLEDILGAVYQNQKVEIDKNKINFNTDLFKLVIKSNNGEASVKITFRIADCNVIGITLDKEEIQF